MKLIRIGQSRRSLIKSINLNHLKDQDENEFESPPDPANNLVFDPRPVGYDHNGYTFEIKVQAPDSDSDSDSDFIRGRLIITRTDKNEGWWHRDVYFRVYDRTKEDVPAAFNSSVPYVYWGLNRERAPADTVVVEVHCTVTTIKKYAFYRCKKMITCDMTNAPVEEIEEDAFIRCSSVRTISFSPVLRNIGRAAFIYCSAIDVLVIPPAVRNIEYFAFYRCRNMRIFKIPDAIDLHNVADDIINYCEALEAAGPANKTPKQWLKDRYNPFPLHKVCYNLNVTVEEIQQCIQQHPYAAYLSDEFNMTALHMITLIACTSNLQTASRNDQDQQQQITSGASGLITACFHANMSAAFVQDDRGKTPLNYLLEYSKLDVHTSLMASLCVHWNASVG